MGFYVWPCLSRDLISPKGYLRYLLRRYRNRKPITINPDLIMAVKAMSKASFTGKKIVKKIYYVTVISMYVFKVISKTSITNIINKILVHFDKNVLKIMTDF